MRRSKSTRREVLKIAGATALGVSAAPGDAAAQVLGGRPCGRFPDEFLWGRRRPARKNDETTCDRQNEDQRHQSREHDAFCHRCEDRAIDEQDERTDLHYAGGQYLGRLRTPFGARMK
jgi:hypothetical protein